MRQIGEAPSSNKESTEVTMTKIITRGVASVIICFFVATATCTMQSNTYDPEREKAETLQTQADAEAKVIVAKGKAEIEQGKLQLLEQMINDGVSPIEARCAVFGWDEDDHVCLNLVKPKHETTHQEE